MAKKDYRTLVITEPTNTTDNHMQGPANCRELKCIQDWLDLGGGTQDEEDVKTANGEYGVQHCSMEGCHSTFYRNHTGDVCEGCGKDVCELCCSYGGFWTKNEDTWYCTDCGKPDETDDDTDKSSD